jgi:hypothetical protein
MRAPGRSALVISLLLVAAGCASPGYILGPSPSGKDEATPIEPVRGAVLIHDRARFVVYERVSKDGSVRVHYAIIVKNSGETPLRLALEKTYLKGKIEIPGEFAAADLSAGRKPLDPGTTGIVTVRFRLPREEVESGEPFVLVVPLEGGEVLREKVWLWKA